MIKRRSQILCCLFFLSDLVLTGLAWYGAYYVRCQSGWLPLDVEPPDLALCLQQLPLVWLLAALGYRWVGMYEINRLRRFRDDVVAVFNGTVLLVLLVMATLFFQRNPYASRGVILLFALLNLAGVLIGRRSAWALIRALRSRGFNQKFSLIVGTGRVARKMARSLRRIAWLGIKNVGFVEEMTSRSAGTGDLDVLGGFADLPELIRKYQIEHVFIALPMSRYDDARKVYAVLSQLVVDVRLVADVPNLAGLSLTTTWMDGLPLIGLRESPHFGLNVVVKRVMDVALSLLALLLLSPLLCLIALLVKLTSRGDVLYRQERCGLNGKSFQMLKFRSLRVNAESETGRGLGAEERQPQDLARGFSAQHQPGRAAAVAQCPVRRHEPGRPTAGTTLLCAAIQQDHPQLHGAPLRQGRHHRLGPGPRLARQHLAPQAHSI